MNLPTDREPSPVEMTEPDLSLEPFILAGAMRAAVGKLTRRLRDKALPSDFSWSQAHVLGRLERGPATLTALARAENMRSQSMGAIVGPLEQAGLIVGAPDPNDGRQTILSITDAGRAYVHESRKTREDWLAERIKAKLTPEELRTVAKAVTLIERIACG